MKKLILAEKPSVAAEIAAALNVPEKGRIYENDEYVVSNFIGHVADIHSSEFDIKDAPLPILPEHFNLLISEGKKDQFHIIKSLLARKDIGTVYNACDADREGESIFMRVYTMTKCRLPVKRMWIMATNTEAYRKAFRDAKDGRQYLPLFHAAMGRAESDMVWGYNGSSALKTAFGRVQTPTLGMVCNAYEKNVNFIPTDYFEIIGTFGIKMGNFEAKLLDEDGNILRCEKEADAVNLISSLEGKHPDRIEDEVKEENKNAPNLFDMNTLLREAAKKYKYKAEKTTALMQDLYEKLGAITYPRTDYDALHEDQKTQDETFEMIRKFAGMDSYRKIVSLLEKHNLLVFNKRVFDESRTSGHYAVVPTGMIKTGKGEKSIDKLSESELKNCMTQEQWNIYNLIILRTIAAFCPPAKYHVTVRKVFLSNKIFRSSDKILVRQGWFAVYGKEVSDDKDKKQEAMLPALETGETGITVALDKKAGKTTAPPLLTEDTLLRMMETAGRMIEDEELSKSIKDKGLGTSATRTAIITGLQKDAKSGRKAYVNDTKKGLVPSAIGMALYQHLKKHYPRSIDPVITGEWEYFLKQVEDGRRNKEDFMAGIYEEVTKFCHIMAECPMPKVHELAETLCTCPACTTGELVERKFTYTCNNASCGFKLWKEAGGKKLSKTILQKLCKNGKSDVIEGFTSKSGKTFSAALKLVDNENAEGGLKMTYDFPEQTSKGNGEYAILCPCCNSKMLDKAKLVECSSTESCGFKIWKTVSGCTLSDEDIRELAENRKTCKTFNFEKKAGGTFTAGLRVDDGNRKVVFAWEEKKR